MTNETEVLRISGNVTVPKEDIVDFKSALDHLFKEWAALGVHWSGNVVPQDDETGMRLYRVEEVEGLRQLEEVWRNAYNKQIDEREANDKLTLSLSEELAQEREKYYKLYKSFVLLDDKCVSQDRTIGLQSDTIQALEKRLELAENNRWRTFIKWWKGLWKRLKLK
jgi:hypothetical protein